MDPEYPPPVDRDDRPIAFDTLTQDLVRHLRAVAATINAAVGTIDDDLSDWSAYPHRACLPDEPLADISDLCRFLGGDTTSFTGDLLALIAKARFDPENLNRLVRGFPRHVCAWVMWSNMSAAAPLTAGDLKALLELAHNPRKGNADVRAHG